MTRNWLNATRPSLIAFLWLPILGCAADPEKAYPGKPFPERLCAEVFKGLSGPNKPASTILALDNEGNLVSALTPSGEQGCEKVVARPVKEVFPIKTDTVFSLKSLGIMGWRGSSKHTITDSAGYAIIVRHPH